MFATKDKITQIQFNQDGSCFVAAKTGGFSVYNTDPFKEIHRQVFGGMGVKVCAMLWKSSLIAFTGASSSELEAYITNTNRSQRGKAHRHSQKQGKGASKSLYSHLYSPMVDYECGNQSNVYENAQEKHFQPNIVYLYDVQVNKILGKLKYSSEVHQIQMRKDILLIKLEKQIYLHALADLFLIDAVDSADYAPPCAMSQLPLDTSFDYLKESCKVDQFNDQSIKQYFTINKQFSENDFILAYIGPEDAGRVNINYYLYGSNDTENIVVHKYLDVFKDPISALTIDFEGKMLVIANLRGEIIVINVEKLTVIAKLSDLTDQVQITGIQIKSDLRQILVTYKGGCAIYNINQINGYLITTIQENERFITLQSNVKFQNTMNMCQTFGLNQDIYITLNDSNIYTKEKIRAGTKQQQPIARVQLI